MPAIPACMDIQVVHESIGRVLGTVALVAQAARLQQQHHARAVAPLLQGAAAVTAATALASALDRTQGHALNALRTALEAFFAQVCMAAHLRHLKMFE